MHVRHASVEVQVHCVNVVIGVVLELHVVRVVPIVVCDDAVIRRSLVLVAFHRSHCFVVEVSVAIFLYLEKGRAHASWIRRWSSMLACAAARAFAVALLEGDSSVGVDGPTPSVHAVLGDARHAV